MQSPPQPAAITRTQQELARLGIDYSKTSFIDNARNGNAEAVKLFLEAGMNTEVKTRDGQAPLMVAGGWK